MGFAAARIGIGTTVLLLACSTSSAPKAAADPDAGADASVRDAGPDGGGTLDVAMSAAVKSGDDFYHCKYVTLPRAASGATTFFVAASHTYGGCHHILVFRTNLTAIPAGQEGERDCFAPDDVMPHARAQIYGSELRVDSFTMPDGVGLPLADGEVLLVQVHYLNAAATSSDANASLTLRTATVGVTQRAGAFYFADPFIDVGVGQRGQASMRCVIPQDATLLTVAGTAHARATDFSAFLDPAGAPPSTSPLYRAPGTANPLPLRTSKAVAGGEHVRFSCTFDNARGTTEILGGPRNDADEACALSGLYTPAQGDDVDACRAAPDGFGTGAATCAQTRACVDACPAASAPPPDLGLGDGGAADPCWQRCMVASCSDASRLLLTLRACVAARCASSCAGGPSAPCTTCIQSSCTAESNACDAYACP